MTYLVVKATISAVIIVAVSELAKRSPALAALVASLPLVSVLGMIWLSRDTGDTARLATHAEEPSRHCLPDLATAMQQSFDIWVTASPAKPTCLPTPVTSSFHSDQTPSPHSHDLVKTKMLPSLAMVRFGS